MIRFVCARMLWLVPNILVLTFLLFAVLTSWLGSPATMMLGLDASPEAIRDMSHVYGFDDPLLQQYARWLWAALHGDLGRSFATKQTVTSMLGDALPISIELALWAIGFAAMTAITLSSLTTPGTFASGLLSTVSVVAITIPNFMMGATLVYVFAIYLRWLPTSGWVPWSDGMGDHVSHLVLPVLTLCGFYFGSFSMIYRAEYRTVMNQLFVRVAKAKGLSDSRVSFQHILPNSVLPVITFMGITLGQLMGGAVITEVVFSLPGVGRTFVSAIRGNDYPLILAIGMIVLTGMMISNLIADVAIAWINPKGEALVMSGRNIQRWLGFGIVGVIATVAIFAPWLAPLDPNASSSTVLASPSASHLVGTDHLGRDVLSRLLFGSRVSLIIGLAASAVGMSLGVPIGLLAGYLGGKFEFAAVQVIDILISLPAIVLALIITAIVGTSVTNLVIILGLLKWPVIARIVRGQVLVIREQAYIEAARSIGCSSSRILFRHIAPQITGVLGAQFALATSASIFTAASLSFLGLGLPPPAADWGGMVESGFEYMFLHPLLALAPGGAVTLTVLSFYLIGESAK